MVGNPKDRFSRVTAQLKDGMTVSPALQKHCFAERCVINPALLFFLPKLGPLAYNGDGISS